MVRLEKTRIGEWEEMEGGWTSGRASDRAKDGGGRTCTRIDINHQELFQFIDSTFSRIS